MLECRKPDRPVLPARHEHSRNRDEPPVGMSRRTIWPRASQRANHHCAIKGEGSSATELRGRESGLSTTTTTTTTTARPRKWRRASVPEHEPLELSDRVPDYPGANAVR